MDFTELITDVTSLERLRPLLRALGFGREWLELAAEQFPAPLRSPTGEYVQRFILAGKRTQLSAFVLQLPRLDTGAAARAARRLHSANPARLAFFLFCDASLEQIALGSFGASEDLRLLFIERANVRATDLEALRELVPRSGERGLALALRQSRVLDRSRVTQRFFLDFKAQRALIAEAWRGLPRAAEEDRRQLALLFLCRLMFLYFLQRRGHLGGDPDYLYALWRSWAVRKHNQSFYAARIKPLFFGVLNRRPERRSGAARRFGALPYLNGGLFDRHALERKYRSIDLPDRIVRGSIEELLQRYRFTTQDSAEAAAARTIDAGIDPEMLGRVFEELMAEGQRGDTGTFFTPPAVVDRMVLSALKALLSARGHAPDALRNLRVLDPACGSGAFLLGALNRIAEARAPLEGGDIDRIKRELVERALHGVDLQEDAALLCALRLWLCLLPSVGPHAPRSSIVQPLPNLDRHIRQGDALVDPIDLATASVDARDVSRSIAASPAVRGALKSLRPAASRYVTAEPDERQALQCELQQKEAQLAHAWIDGLEARLCNMERELRATAGEVDLFGERTEHAYGAARALAQLKERQQKLAEAAATLKDKRGLPFFSFDIHFAEAGHSGFDLIVSNPPWVRSHRWPETLGRVVRERYEVCRAAGWHRESGSKASGAQVDLSLLFLERALRLLAPGGALAMLLPAKSFRSLYAGGARALILREGRISCIEDHSLDQRSIFKADAFAGALIATRGEPDPTARIRVSCHQRKAPPLEFELLHKELSLVPAEPASPWLLVPPDVAAALRTMRSAGLIIGARRDLPIHRGVFTGANGVLLIDDVRLKLGDHAWVRAEGFTHTPAGERRSAYRALIEESALRPVIAGANLRAWSYGTERAILWSHDASGRATTLPARAARYVKRHAERLMSRSSWRTSMPPGSVFGVDTHTTQAKMAWRDIAPTLEAVALPASITRWGRSRELIPLNTVYYVSVHDDRCALLLAAYFNSTPVRTFARALAERAKDAHFRFFGWTIAQVPLPHAWDQGTRADRLTELARAAAERGAMTAAEQQELDHLVCAAYALSTDQCAALNHYDHWLGAAHR